MRVECRLLEHFKEAVKHYLTFVVIAFIIVIVFYPSIFFYTVGIGNILFRMRKLRLREAK